ncbi:hypothetical protein NW754_003468 [Fusarium falciforme]|nr:hypothetical protein NW754_003468 [Fusarium falciforme]
MRLVTSHSKSSSSFRRQAAKTAGGASPLPSGLVGGLGEGWVQGWVSWAVRFFPLAATRLFFETAEGARKPLLRSARDSWTYSRPELDATQFHLLGFQGIVIYKGAAIWKHIKHTIWKRITIATRFHLLGFQGIVIYKGAAIWKHIKRTIWGITIAT